MRIVKLGEMPCVDFLYLRTQTFNYFIEKIDSEIEIDLQPKMLAETYFNTYSDSSGHTCRTRNTTATTPAGRFISRSSVEIRGKDTVDDDKARSIDDLKNLVKNKWAEFMEFAVHNPEHFLEDRSTRIFRILFALKHIESLLDTSERKDSLETRLEEAAREEKLMHDAFIHLDDRNSLRSNECFLSIGCDNNDHEYICDILVPTLRSDALDTPMGSGLLSLSDTPSLTRPKKSRSKKNKKSRNYVDQDHQLSFVADRFNALFVSSRFKVTQTKLKSFLMNTIKDLEKGGLDPQTVVAKKTAREYEKIMALIEIVRKTYESDHILLRLFKEAKQDKNLERDPVGRHKKQLKTPMGLFSKKRIRDILYHRIKETIKATPKMKSYPAKLTGKRKESYLRFIRDELVNIETSSPESSGSSIAHFHEAFLQDIYQLTYGTSILREDYATLIESLFLVQLQANGTLSKHKDRLDREQAVSGDIPPGESYRKTVKPSVHLVQEALLDGKGYVAQKTSSLLATLGGPESPKPQIPCSKKTLKLLKYLASAWCMVLAESKAVSLVKRDDRNRRGCQKTQDGQRSSSMAVDKTLGFFERIVKNFQKAGASEKSIRAYLKNAYHPERAVKNVTLKGKELPVINNNAIHDNFEGDDDPSEIIHRSWQNGVSLESHGESPKAYSTMYKTANRMVRVLANEVTGQTIDRLSRRVQEVDLNLISQFETGFNSLEEAIINCRQLKNKERTERLAAMGLSREHINMIVAHRQEDKFLNLMEKCNWPQLTDELETHVVRNDYEVAVTPCNNPKGVLGTAAGGVCISLDSNHRADHLDSAFKNLVVFSRQDGICHIHLWGLLVSATKDDDSICYVLNNLQGSVKKSVADKNQVAEDVLRALASLGTEVYTQPKGFNAVDVTKNLPVADEDEKVFINKAVRLDFPYNRDTGRVLFNSNSKLISGEPESVVSLRASNGRVEKDDDEELMDMDIEEAIL